MECQQCKYTHTRVVETRKNGDHETRRRRECLRCGARFTTTEHHYMKPDKKAEDYYREIGK